MPCNLARSLSCSLWAWCSIALRVVSAHPALQGSLKGHDLAPAIDSSHGDLSAPSNHQYHAFNHGEVVNHKRLREQVPHQSQSSHVEPQSPDLDVHRDYLDLEPENGIRSPRVAKRPTTVQDGHFATPIPQSLNPGSDPSSLFGAATNDRSGLSGLKGHQFNHLRSPVFPSASSASLHQTSIPPQEVGKPWDDLTNMPGLYHEWLNSEFGKITDSTWPSSFGHQTPPGQSTCQNIPTPGPPFQSTSSHGFERDHGDLSVSQPSMQFDHFDNSPWSPQWAHSCWPEPQSTPQQIQAQSLLDHSASHSNPHGNQLDFQGQASHHIQSGQPSEDHTYSQGLATSGSLVAHSTGESSEKMGKNHSFMQAITEWDAELALLSIPDVSKDHDLLQQFMTDFKRRTHGKLDVKSLRQVDITRDDLIHLPVGLFKDSRSPLYTVRVLRAPEYHNHKSIKSLAGQNTPEKLLNQFYSLIHWLLFINTAILRRLHAQGSISEESDEADSNHRLMGWLFGETFEPSNSWPIVGKITPQVARARGDTFGPIQKILIAFLSSPSKLKREVQTAVLLASHYYEDQFPEIWKELGIVQIVDFKSLIKKSIESKMIIGKGFNKLNWIEKLGNFPIRSLQSIPEVLQQSDSHSHSFSNQFKVTPGKKEQELREYIQDIMLLSRKHCAFTEIYRLNLNPEDCPVLIARKSYDSTGLKQGMVWIRDHKNDKSFIKRQLNSKIKKFLDHLNVCFSKLMECKEEKGIQTGDDTEYLFFDWFHNILFKTGEGKLPLLGDFNWEKGRPVDSFSAQDFNEVQALMLNLIPDPNSHRRNFQVSLSVLGYWLKNEQGQLYNQLFKNDDQYWDHLTHLIKSEFDWGPPIKKRKS